VNELAGSLTSDLIVVIRIEERSPRRGQTGPDSAMLRITAYDLTARPQYAQRSVPSSAQWGLREEILGSLEATLLQAVGALEEMSRAPRRLPTDPQFGPAGTTTMTLPDGRVIQFPAVPLSRGGVEVRTNPPRKPPQE
jgi:hypothetical protein